MPYPPEHRNHQMMNGPEAVACAPGFLGGLFQWKAGLTLGPNVARSLFFSTAFYGVCLLGAPMAVRVDPRASGIFYSLIPALALIFGGLMLITRRLSRAKVEGEFPSGLGLIHRREWPVFLTVIAWLGGSFVREAPVAAIPIAAGSVALIALLLDTRALLKQEISLPFSSPWLYPGRLAQSLTIGAGMLLPLALALGLATAELKLTSRLFALGLLVHVAVNQIVVAQNTPGSAALRVGPLCVAYRWVLWLGGLLPMLLLALFLLETPFAEPGLAFGGPLAAWGVFIYINLALRAAQGVNIVDGGAD